MFYCRCKDLASELSIDLQRGWFPRGMISDFRSDYFRMSVLHQSRLKFPCPPVFLFPKSAKIYTSFSNSVAKIGQFPCSVVIGTPIPLQSVFSQAQTVLLQQIEGNTVLGAYRLKLLVQTEILHSETQHHTQQKDIYDNI